MTRRQLFLAAAIISSVLSLAPRGAKAQATSVFLPPNPTVIHTTSSVTIGGTFSVDVGAVTQNSLQANPCNPGACYDAITTVHANRGWQLQVTLNQTPANFTVRWIEKPGNIGHPLTAGVYQTIATGNAATPAQTISSMYNADKFTGRGGGGFIPTAAQVAAVLSYRVIASP
jgi:hypothetical protein